MLCDNIEYSTSAPKNTMTIIDKHFTFFGLHRQPATCRIRIFSKLDAREQARPIHDDENATTRSVIVIATELHDNPGASITNVAEKCAAQVCLFHDIHPSRLIWVEHYDERDLPRHHWAAYRPEGEGFNLVTFDFRNKREVNDEGGPTLGTPTWKHSNKAAVELMIGESLP